MRSNSNAPSIRAAALLVLTLLLASTRLAQARVVQVEVVSREEVLAGHTFGAAGPYERLRGRVHFSVRVDNPHNAAIVDLRRAANLRDGEVEFSADFIAYRPRDAARGNGSMLLEVPNRGRPGILTLVDGGDRDLEKDAGDGWLLRNGYTLVSLGWQWDATDPTALRLHAPIAKAEGGGTITGLVRGDLMLSKAMDEIPLGHLILGNIGGSEYPVTLPADPRNVLTVRDSRDAQRVLIPTTEWSFARSTDGALLASDRTLRLKGGFQPGKIYEYVYVAADPVVAGLGLAAVRDFASYAKHGADPALHAERVYGEGISQNGRYLRDFLYQGFNADEEGRIVLDGVLAHVAGAGRGSFNLRFAQPSRDAQPTSSVDFPTDLFPFTDLPETDPLTGARAGLLDRAAAERVVPRIFLSNTSYEYWGRAAALIHVSADGRRDVTLSPQVRIYHFTGLQHFSGPYPPARGPDDLLGEQPESPLPIHYFWRAMISNMDAWVRAGTAPPDSAYPRIDGHTLVPLSAYAFPEIPGVRRPHEANAAWRLDFGPEAAAGIFALEPPRRGRPFPVLVPQVDADGNERDGVRLPEISVPLATYSGWNLRDPAIGAPGERVAFEGSFIPFAASAEERRMRHDPRPAVLERYASKEDYLARYSRAVDALIRERWVLPEDRAALLQRGETEWQAATAGLASSR
jgi:hypothetical protein